MADSRFKSGQARRLVEYVHKKYGRDIEHLWARMPDDGVWRRADNEKWFGGIFHVSLNKVEPGAGNHVVEILDIRCAPEMLGFIVDKKTVFPGWHMNKRHWITIVLDGRMDLRNVCRLLDASYGIAGGK